MKKMIVLMITILERLTLAQNPLLPITYYLFPKNHARSVTFLNQKMPKIKSWKTML